MIHVTIYRKHGQVCGFNCIGHAGYAAAGQDIVCAGASALVINAVNSIEQLTSARFDLVTDDEDGSGLIELNLQETASPEAALLLDSMILGLKGIQSGYGKKFLRLDEREV